MQLTNKLIKLRRDAIDAGYGQSSESETGINITKEVSVEGSDEKESFGIRIYNGSLALSIPMGPDSKTFRTQIEMRKYLGI